MKKQSRQERWNLQRRSTIRQKSSKKAEAIEWSRKKEHPPWILAFGVCLAAYVGSHCERFRIAERRSKTIIRRTIYLSKQARSR